MEISERAHRRRTPAYHVEHGVFQHGQSLTANNIVLTIYKHVTNPECRQYLLRQAYEEAVHTDTFIYCCDTFGLKPEEVYDAYEKIPSIRDKDAFVVDMTKSLMDPALRSTPSRTNKSFCMT